ncbi:MAG: hypothetical protein MUC36_25745 [Planctomycetes bacterium]|jgi:hypothetical protein|nr:hypothetical protein [Planctomycetota bacterium]
MRTATALATLLLVACGEQQPSPTPPPQPRPGATPVLLAEHDFGIIPHGETRQHEFELDLARLPATYVPLRVHLDCTCGTAELRLRSAEGVDRPVTGTGLTDELPHAGERLVLRVIIDTANKEAIDLAATESKGYVLLQSPEDDTGRERVQWPIRLRFGIDSPVLLRPFASLDFGRVAQSQTPEVLTLLTGDAAHPGLTFGPVACDDAALLPTLEASPDGTRVRVRCRPGAEGSYRATLTIGTDLPSGYRVRLPVTWKVVPDLEAAPMAKVSFRTALGRAQTAAEIQGQFVLISDHDQRRRPEFAVHRIVGDDGRDLAPHFEVTMVQLPDQPRQHRLFVRYLGGLADGVRGVIELTKDGANGPFLPIDLVVFPAKDA